MVESNLVQILGRALLIEKGSNNSWTNKSVVAAVVSDSVIQLCDLAIIILQAVIVCEMKSQGEGETGGFPCCCQGEEGQEEQSPQVIVCNCRLLDKSG